MGLKGHLDAAVSPLDTPPRSVGRER
jgi:hypothetical protein